MRVLDDHNAAVLRSLCELIVPGSGRVWPEVYIDAVLASMPEEDREFALGAIATLEPASGSGDELAASAGTPAFGLVRALAVEAFYSDFVAPGAPGPGAYEEIDFSLPMATRIQHDWSYLLGVPA